MENLGLDLVDVSRFEKHANNLGSRFCLRVYTPYELEYLKSKKAASMAGLFAAKEAVAKAIGAGFRGFFPNDIEIRHDEFGAPVVHLYGRAKELAKDTVIKVSISHTKTAAAAVAFMVKK